MLAPQGTAFFESLYLSDINAPPARSPWAPHVPRLTVDTSCRHNYTVIFEWDERKRRLNLEKHGLDFLDVGAVFEIPYVLVPSAYGGNEERFLAVGMFEGRYVTVVYTTRSEAIRVISFRRARHEERKKYQALYGG